MRKSILSHLLPESNTRFYSL